MQNDSFGTPPAFDPYHKLLGIPKRDQPPNLYRLLGVELLESDRDVIDAAANKQMAYLRDCCNGHHGGEAERLLNEVSEARLRLLNPQSKQQYDAQLGEMSAPQQRSASVDSPKIRVRSGSRTRRKRAGSFSLILSVLVPSGVSFLIAWKMGLLSKQRVDSVSTQPAELSTPAAPIPSTAAALPTSSSAVPGVDHFASRPASSSATHPRGSSATGSISNPERPTAIEPSGQTAALPSTSSSSGISSPDTSSTDTSSTGMSSFDPMERLRSFRMLASSTGDSHAANQGLPTSDQFVGLSLPIPTVDEIAVTTEEVESILATKIAEAQTPHEKKHFATACYHLADETEQPAAKYALLQMSCEYFRQADDFSGAMLAVDAIASRFQTDVSSQRADLITELTRTLHRPSEQVAATNRAETLIHAALKAEDYATVIELSKIGKRMAIEFKNIAMNKKFTSLVEEAMVLQQAHPKVEAARERLKLEPDNSKASEYLGRFLCFGKSEWNEGLRLLQHAENAKLAEIAELELRLPAGAESAEKLADQWWELAALATSEPALATGCQERAVYWYRYALANGLAGLSRAAAQTHIDAYSSQNEERLAARSAANVDLRTPTPPRGVPPEAIHFDGNWYLFSTKKVRFEAAVAIAARAGGRLVVVRSEAENDFLLQHAYRPCMLGILRRDGVWYDALGERQFFFMWDERAGQPEGIPEEPLVALYRRTTRWHDFTDDPMFFAIEWGKE